MNQEGYTMLAISGPAALVFMAVFIILVIFPLFFYLNTLSSILKEIGPENRKMAPEQVWLSLIPIFGIIWQYFIVSRIADSINLELTKRNIYSVENRPGYNIGIIYCILFSFSIIPYIGILSAVGGIVCWLVYWIRINEYRNRLIENPINYLSK